MDLSLQLAKRMKDSDRDDFLDVLGSENEGKLKSPPAQQVRKEEGQGHGEGQQEGRVRRGRGGGVGGGLDPKAPLITPSSFGAPANGTQTE